MTRPFKGEVLVFDGMHSRVIAMPEIGVAFKVYPYRLRSNAVKEYKALLASEGLEVKCTPRPYGFVEGPNFVVVVREYVEGVYFDEYVEGLDVSGFRELVLNLINCLAEFDKVGIVLDELSSPRRNIVVRGGRPYIIDLERWSQKAASTNVTRFLGFLVKMCKSEGNLGNLIRNLWGEEKLLQVSSTYKKDRDLGKLLETLKLLSFR